MIENDQESVMRSIFFAALVALTGMSAAPALAQTPSSNNRNLNAGKLNSEAKRSRKASAPMFSIRHFPASHPIRKS